MSANVQKAFKTATASAKIADLQRDTDELNKSSGLKTDFGLSISNTDDWYILSYDLQDQTN